MAVEWCAIGTKGRKKFRNCPRGKYRNKSRAKTLARWMRENGCKNVRVVKVK